MPSEEALSTEHEALREGESEGEPGCSQIGNRAALEAQLTREREWFARLNALLGPKILKRYGGMYRNMLREKAGLFERVFNAVAQDKRERLGKIGNLGKHFRWLWVTEFGAYPERMPARDSDDAAE